jgi:hypothetical protein|nr:MAG TPA: hypothetical protein [Caudoviricetes sp.]
MSCDHPGCGHTIRLPERPPGLTQDASDIREFHSTASVLGWFIDEDNYDIVFCPNHTPTKENQ